MSEFWLTNENEFRLKIYPNDFNKVYSFYKNVLKFPILKEWDRPKYQGVMFDTGSTILELFTPENGYKPVSSCDLSLTVKNVWLLWQEFKGKDFVSFSIRDDEWGETSFEISYPEVFLSTFFTRKK
jgi:hypothetical protein